MITSSQARSMAEARWGRGGTNASPTNRRGAFYFSCSGHGGFVIDARCLTADERKLMERFLTPAQATEVYDYDTGKTRKMRSPDSTRSMTYLPGSQGVRNLDIFFAEEDCDYAVPMIAAGIMTDGMTRADAARSLLRWKSPSKEEIEMLGIAEFVEESSC